MATISPKKLARALDEFFRERLVPAGAAMKKRSGTLFPLGADASATSYFIPRRVTRMEKSDFETLGTASPETLARDLAAMWNRAGVPELAALAPEMADLARAAREAETEQEGDVSPFVYAMY